MSKAVTQKDRIIYIEPNNLPSIHCVTNQSASAENIFWNPEDLNISVDLQVIIPAREYNRAENIDNLNYMGSYKKTGGYASAMAGVDITGHKDRFLTDDYTMINYQEILATGSGSKELLGINSINIKFDAHLFPVVDMSFTDVRAASLMMPEEQKNRDIHYGNNANEGSACKSFFQSFFHFPYPRFLLSVKGQYGTFVTFTLTIETFNAKFNSETGNFDVNVHFIGLMYGLYTDISFNYIFAAPDIVSVNGNGYWESQVQNGTFCYSEDGSQGAPIMTFEQFLNEYQNFTSNITDSTSTGALASIELARGTIERMAEVEPLLKRLNDELKKGDSNKVIPVIPTTNDLDFICIYKTGTPTNDKTNYKDVAVYAKAVADKLGIDITDFYELYYNSEIKDLCEKEKLLYLEAYGTDGNLRSVDYFKQKLGGDEWYGNMAEQVHKMFENDTSYRGFNPFFSHKVLDYANKQKEGAQETFNENIAEANEQLGELFKNKFGFTPNLENVFRMIFAHLDTFLQQYYNTIDEVGTTRKIKDFGIGIRNTDIASNAGSNAFMPPFTGFYEKDQSSGLMERFYPGNHDKLSTIPEVNLVKTLLTGIDNLSDIGAPTDLNEGSDSGSTGQASSTYAFAPTSYYDLYSSGTNKYLNLNARSDDFPENLVKVFQQRLTYAYHANSDVAGGNYLSAYIDAEYRNCASIINAYYKWKGGKAVITQSAVVDFDDGNYPIFGDSGKNSSIIKTVDNVSAYLNGKDFVTKKNNFINAMAPGFPDKYWNENFVTFVMEDFLNGAGSCLKMFYHYDDRERTTTIPEHINNHPFKIVGLYWEGETIRKNILRSDGLLGDYARDAGVDDMNPEIVAYYLVKAFNINDQYIKGVLKGGKAHLAEIPFHSFLLFSARSHFKGASGLPLYLPKDSGQENYGIPGDYLVEFAKSDEFKPILEHIKNILKNPQNYLDGDHFKQDETKDFQDLLGKFWNKTVWVHVPKDQKTITAEELSNAVDQFIQVIGASNSYATDEGSSGTTDELEPPDEVILKLATNQKTLESAYYSLKNLYDRWISTYPRNIFKLKSPQAAAEAKKKRLGSAHQSSYADKNFSEFDNFLFVDGFFNDISSDYFVNMDTFYRLLNDQRTGKTNFSVLEFISMLCRENKLLFKGLPTINNFYDASSIEEIFKPHNPYEVGSDMRRGAGNTYLIMYTYEPANKLGFGNEPDKLGVGYANDGFMIYDGMGSITEEAVQVFKKGHGMSADVTAFGVTPGKQNQSYFTSVSIGMDNPRVTDVSLANKFAIASSAKMASEGNISGVGTGQDLFSIYSNRSYDCSVEMLGCANLMPLMYFQLNNVPMFRGVYRIMQVEHSIQNNTMKTKFVGTKVSKYAIPFNKEVFNVETMQMIMKQYGQTAFSSFVSNMANITVERDETGALTFTSSDSRVFVGVPDPASYEQPFYVNSARRQMGVPMTLSTKKCKGTPIAGLNNMNDKNNKCAWLHVCASYVTTYVGAGLLGYDTGGGSKIRSAMLKGEGMPNGVRGFLGDGFYCSENLPKFGFKAIAYMRGDGTKCVYDSDQGEQLFLNPEAGDVVTLYSPSASSKFSTGPRAGEPIGHITMAYDGNTFVSDTNEGSYYWHLGGRDAAKQKGSMAILFRHCNRSNESPTFDELKAKRDGTA